MKKRFSIVAALAVAFTALPSAASEGENWMCRYKGYSEDGNYYYIAVRPFEGDAQQSRDLNDHDFAKALFDDLAPGKRFSGELACAMRPRDVTTEWFDKMLAGDDMFSSSYNTTLAEWRDGRIVAMPWPDSPD
jgi:ABC-type oligopeptide transport system substrate-binding subunit